MNHPQRIKKQLPIFPLHCVLFPGGRVTLQIFEIRYLDMIKDCLKNENCFGIVFINKGAEVMSSKGQPEPEVERFGCLAKIVDWASLPHQRLKIVVEGEQRFRLISHEISKDGLMLGDVELLDKELPEPLSLDFVQLTAVLEGLLEHEQIKRMMISCDLGEAVQTSNLLAQLLPIPENEKQCLLLMSVDKRLTKLDQLLRQLGGEMSD